MSKPRQLGHYLWTVCLGEKLPVWATILGVIVGGLLTAFGTYLIVPSINQSLERQKIRTEFIIRNLDDLNSRTRILVSEVSDLHYAVLKTNQADPDVIQKMTARIAEMQWKAIELAVIFEGTAGALVVSRYQASLENVRMAITSVKTKEDLALSQRAVEVLTERTLDVIRELAAIGGLRVTPTVAGPKVP